MTNYLYDSHQVRYELYQTNEGKNYNWLVFPGGPGADSSYLRSLVNEVNLPGNVWLIDFPEMEVITMIPLQITLISGLSYSHILLNNLIILFWSDTHFGGMLPLLYPELEISLKGCVYFEFCPWCLV